VLIVVTDMISTACLCVIHAALRIIVKFAARSINRWWLPVESQGVASKACVIGVLISLRAQYLRSSQILSPVQSVTMTSTGLGTPPKGTIVRFMMKGGNPVPEGWKFFGPRVLELASLWAYCSDPEGTNPYRPGSIWYVTLEKL
jgi:hypothetical protein